MRNRNQILGRWIRHDLVMTVFFLAFGLIYECFSHQVYSGYMLLSFLFPLLGGLMPDLLLRSRRTRFLPGPWGRGLISSGIFALTMASVLTGVLEIYGTTNHLMGLLWGLGILFAAAGLVCCLASLVRARVKTAQM